MTIEPGPIWVSVGPGLQLLDVEEARVRRRAIRDAWHTARGRIFEAHADTLRSKHRAVAKQRAWAIARDLAFHRGEGY